MAYIVAWYILFHLIAREVAIIYAFLTWYMSNSLKVVSQVCSFMEGFQQKKSIKMNISPEGHLPCTGSGAGEGVASNLKSYLYFPKHFLWDSCLIFSTWGDYQWSYLLALIEIMAMIAIFIFLQIHSKVSHSDIGLLNKWLWGSCETSPEMKGAWMFVYSCPHCTYIIFCAATSLFYHFLRW